MTVTRQSGNPYIGIDSRANLVFTETNWATPQTVTLRAVANAELLDLFGTAFFQLSGSGVSPSQVDAVRRLGGNNISAVLQLLLGD